MPNFIGITLFAAVLQCAAHAAAQDEQVSRRRTTGCPPHKQLNDAASLHQRARGNLDNGNHERALEDLHAAIQINPYYTQAYYLRGQIFAETEGLRPSD